MSENPTKFHKSLGNVKDTDVSDGEILLLQTLIRLCEDDIVKYRMKEERAKEKIEKIWTELRQYKSEAQASRIFVDQHPLFTSMCDASGITVRSGREMFYSRVEDKIQRQLDRRRRAKDAKRQRKAKTRKKRK